jgi:hypothetical protein
MTLTSTLQSNMSDTVNNSIQTVLFTLYNNQFQIH